MLNDKLKTYDVEYGILLLLNAENNQIIFNTFFYKGMNFKATACPYTNWVSRYGLLKFIPENHIMENGFFEKKNDKAHIVVPIYPRKNDLNFFVCGTWKQPKIPDIKIGFSLLPDDNGMDHLSDVDALGDSLTCDGTNKADKYYHFGYMTEESNFAGKKESKRNRAANILVVYTKQKEHNSVAIQKEIEVTKTMDGFGKYSCSATRTTAAYKNNLITIQNTYFLPVDRALFNLTDIVFNNNNSVNLTNCIGKYDDWGILSL
uniref:Uncharacterized protein n=1 Tax=Parastrongyloides trichosuri TaxID=131310 RepID=A0A0N4Z975_PARTI